MEFLLSLTKEALYIIMGVMGGAICALHFVSLLAKEKIARISQYVNIVLHICLFGALMLSQTPISVSVCIFMASAFIYSLTALVKYKLDAKREKDCEEKEEDL